jgi:uncharacterized protein YmfQ (DUF2313 family)
MAGPDYFSQLVLLQPPGAALPRDEDTDWGRLLRGLSLEFERADGRAAVLIAESDPRLTSELLPEWERAYGLPDGCLPSGSTTQERRAAVLLKLRDTGRQDLAYWRELAELLGYDVDVEEFAPFVCAVSECGGPDMCGPEETRFWWQITVYGPRLILFRCGESAPPDRLGDWEPAYDLECLVNRYHQAHTLVTFAYTEFDRNELASYIERLQIIMETESPGITPVWEG